MSALFSDKLWWIFAVIPLYALYYIMKMVADYVFTPTEQEAALNDPAARKRMEKKERKAARAAKFGNRR